MAGSIPPQGMGPGRGIRPQAMGPKKSGRKSTALNKGKGRGGTGGLSGKEPSLIKKGMGPFGHGRKPSVDKDGDPFTKRSPWKKPGNNSFF